MPGGWWSWSWLWRGIHSVKTKTKYKELDIAWCFVWNLNGCNQAAHYFTGEKYPGIIIIILLYFYIFCILHLGNITRTRGGSL